jgi:hypothetical protein
MLFPEGWCPFYGPATNVTVDCLNSTTIVRARRCEELDGLMDRRYGCGVRKRFVNMDLEFFRSSQKMLFCYIHDTNLIFRSIDKIKTYQSRSLAPPPCRDICVDLACRL